MGLSLDGKVSEDDLNRRHDMINHGSYEDGFDSSGGDSGLGDLFGDSGSDEEFDMNDLFSDGDSGSDPFGGGSSSFGGSDPFNSENSSFGGGSSFGGNDSFSSVGSSFGGGNSFGNTFGQPSFGQSGFGQSSFGQSGFGQSSFGQSGFGQNNNQQPVQQRDTLDKFLDVGADTAKNIGEILFDMVKSIKERSADDYGYLGRNLILVGAAIVPIGVVLGIIGVASGIHFLSFSGISLQLVLAGSLAATTGITGIGTAAFVLTKIGDQSIGDASGIQSVPEIPPSEDNFTQDYEDNIGDELADLFGDDFNELSNELDNTNFVDNLVDIKKEEPEDTSEEFEINVDNVSTEINWDEALDNVKENKLINRTTLFNEFKPMFPVCTPEFADSKPVDPSSSEFAQLDTICLKALANIANCELEEVKSHLDSAVESFFSYTLKLKRFNKVKNCDALASEMEIYLREDSNDDSVNATVSLEGDFYKIIVTKGVSAVVSFGDVFKKSEVCDYFLDESNKMPIITGIDELGNVLVEDAKKLDTMMICGKPRSGKSWYVLSILASLMLFNSPEEIQFIIVDPKKSQLFKTVALMPHVCGLHDDSNILGILDDVINVEAPRRKAILSAHKCDDIWALREAGVVMPVLYVVMDEYITIKNNLDPDKQKELNAKIQTLISQLPSQGIRLIFIPHRATGIVDKTNRTMIQFTACVRSNNDDVMDALDIKSWKRSLTKPGDIALKSSEMKTALYTRGAALTSSDRTNTKFLETAAKAFYKMGVDIPDMRALRVACNRDEDYIRQELSGESTRIQYNASTILEDLEDIDYDDLD